MVYAAVATPLAGTNAFNSFCLFPLLSMNLVLALIVLFLGTVCSLFVPSEWQYIFGYIIGWAVTMIIFLLH